MPDAAAETIARLLRSLQFERERNRNLDQQLQEVRAKLRSLESSLVVDPQTRQDILHQIEQLKRENNVLKSRAGNAVKAAQEEAKREETKSRFEKRPGTRKASGDPILERMRELYPDFWNKA